MLLCQHGLVYLVAYNRCSHCNPVNCDNPLARLARQLMTREELEKREIEPAAGLDGHNNRTSPARRP